LKQTYLYHNSISIIDSLVCGVCVRVPPSSPSSLGAALRSSVRSAPLAAAWDGLGWDTRAGRCSAMQRSDARVPTSRVRKQQRHDEADRTKQTTVPFSQPSQARWHAPALHRTRIALHRAALSCTSCWPTPPPLWCRRTHVELLVGNLTRSTPTPHPPVQPPPLVHAPNPPHESSRCIRSHRHTARIDIEVSGGQR
jgi:hypothetical protein